MRRARLIAGSPVPLAKSSTRIPGAGCAYSTKASVTGCPMAADLAFHFSAATRRYWAPQLGSEPGFDVIDAQGRREVLCFLFLLVRSRLSWRLALAGRGFQIGRLQALGRLPQPLQVVELACLLGEDVDDEVHVVHQNPLGLVVAFNVRRTQSRGLQTQFHLVSNGLDLAGIGSAAEHEVVGESSRPFFHFQDAEFFGLLFEAGLDGGLYLVFEFVLFHSNAGRWSLAVSRQRVLHCNRRSIRAFCTPGRSNNR